MAVSLGKRKREDDEGDFDDKTENDVALKALFQKAFEGRFKPLPPSETRALHEEPPIFDAGSVDSDESEWDGLSEDEERVEIFDHDSSRALSLTDENRERRSFMSSKPPKLAETSKVPAKVEVLPDEDPSETGNLKNDLALQRLLKESHLLDAGTFRGKVSAPEGRSRLKSLDLRIQDLGAKKSISEQEKMPLSHRKGISAKATSREGRRRKEAAENGVVLEKARTAIQSAKRRERSVGGPTVGKFKGGTLKLSSRDVRSIEGPKQRGSSGGRKGRMGRLLP